jgi:hypothetical protein
MGKTIKIEENDWGGDNRIPVQNSPQLPNASECKHNIEQENVS